MILKSFKKYYRMYFDLFAVVSSIILVIILILMFGLPIYAAGHDTWGAYDFATGTSNLAGNGVKYNNDASLINVNTLVSPSYYDQQHYNDLIGDSSGWFDYFVKSDSNYSYYEGSYVNYSYSNGAYYSTYLPFGEADNYVIYSGGFYFIKKTTDQFIYYYDDVIISDASFYLARVNASGTYLKGSFNNLNNQVKFDSNSGLYYYYHGLGSNQLIYQADFPIFFDQNLNSTYLNRLSYFKTLLDNDNELLIDGLSNNTILQYNVEDFPAFEFPVEEGSQNNLYFPSCNWSFRIPTYFSKRQDSYYNSNIANILNGYIDFNVELSDYQKEHLEDFYLDVKFSFVSRCHAGSTFNNGSYSDFKTYYGYGVYSGNTSISFDDFVNGQYTWALSDLFNNTSLTSCNVPTEFNSQVGTIFSTFVRNLYFENLSPFAFTDNDEFCVYCSAKVSSNNISSQGTCNSVYDFVGGKSKNNYNNLNYNFEPFVPENDLDNTSEPDNNSTELVSTDGNVSLINYDNDYNNQSIIIEDSSPEFVDGLINRLIPINSDAGLSNEFANMVRLNSWLPFVGTIYSFFPSEFVDALTNYFVTILGILCVAFVLWLLVHIF